MTKDTPARVYAIRSLLLGGVLLIAAYCLFEFRHLILGPVISLEYPHNGLSVTDPLIELRGTTKNVAHLTLNDRQIFVDSKGNLSESLLLSRGPNIIRLKAEDRFGHEVEHVVEIIVHEDTSSEATALKSPFLFPL